MIISLSEHLKQLLKAEKEKYTKLRKMIEPMNRWDINKHIIGKVYDLTQENMNAMIADIESSRETAIREVVEWLRDSKSEKHFGMSVWRIAEEIERRFLKDVE